MVYHGALLYMMMSLKEVAEAVAAAEVAEEEVAAAAVAVGVLRAVMKP